VRGTALGYGRQLGKGPHSATNATPNHEFVQKLADTLGELRDAAREGRWNIDWPTFEGFSRKAEAADRAGDFAEAIRHSCRGVMFMMKELRSQNSKKASDSTIKL